MEVHNAGVVRVLDATPYDHQTLRALYALQQQAAAALSTAFTAFCARHEIASAELVSLDLGKVHIRVPVAATPPPARPSARTRGKK
jgi:hypothetical protein